MEVFNTGNGRQASRGRASATTPVRPDPEGRSGPNLACAESNVVSCPLGDVYTRYWWSISCLLSLFVTLKEGEKRSQCDIATTQQTTTTLQQQKPKHVSVPPSSCLQSPSNLFESSSSSSSSSSYHRHGGMHEKRKRKQNDPEFFHFSLFQYARIIKPRWRSWENFVVSSFLRPLLR